MTRRKNHRWWFVWLLLSCLGALVVMSQPAVPPVYTDLGTESVIATNSDGRIIAGVPVSDTNAQTICDGTTTYLDGDGGCDSITQSSSAGSNYTQSFTTQTSVTLTHNLGTKDLLVMCYDATDIWIEPNDIDISASSPFDVAVTFGESETGRCVVNGNPGTRTNYTQAFATPQTSVTLTHNFGTPNLLIDCYDSTDILIEPSKIDINPADPFAVVVTFLEGQTGRCIVNGVSIVSRFSQAFSATKTVTITGVTHGFDTPMLNVSCYDDSSPRARVGPDKVTVNDSNNDIIITFFENETGKCVLQ